MESDNPQAITQFFDRSSDQGTGQKGR